MKYIIGFQGPKRSGKDFGATKLIEELRAAGFAVHRDSFARNLRTVAAQTTGATPEQLDAKKDVRGLFRISRPALLSVLRINGFLAEGDKEAEYDWIRAIDHQLKLQMRQTSIGYKEESGTDTIVLECTGRDVLIIIGQAARMIHPEFWVRALAIDLSQLPDRTVVVLTDVRPENEARCCDYLIEVTSPFATFTGTATESRLPDHLVHSRIHNPGDATYGYTLRAEAATLRRLIAGKFRDNGKVLEARQYMSPELYNRTFLETI
ncbi:hypothetical protein [Pseudomonas phage Njord]|uniref:Deoxynucleoside monophosphate kinase n=1 Tax=Pseudomonas phage Njord TaxID=2163985 RepID=A0A2S1GML3_9CAUD|nr:hypothetical protein HOT08_gp21 [Pseudomonas phage Njord]AWD90609.1 hypothetical protein [Pseudomonas phage Njord]